MRKYVEGINQLIFGILTSLKNDKVAGWCYTIADNESFWSSMQEEIFKFYELSKPVVIKFFDDHGQQIATGLIALILAALKRRI